MPLTDELGRGLAEVVASTFGILLIGAAAAKLEGIHGWTMLIRKFPFPTTVKQTVWIGIPLTELGIGTLALVRPAFGLAAACLLLLLFAGALSRYLGSIRGAECRCFGNVGASNIDVRLIARNLGLAVVALVAAVGAWTTDANAIPPLQIAVIATVALLAVVLAEYRSLPRAPDVGELSAPPQGGTIDA